MNTSHTDIILYVLNSNRPLTGNETQELIGMFPAGAGVLPIRIQSGNHHYAAGYVCMRDNLKGKRSDWLKAADAGVERFLCDRTSHSRITVADGLTYEVLVINGEKPVMEDMERMLYAITVPASAEIAVENILNRDDVSYRVGPDNIDSRSTYTFELYADRRPADTMMAIIQHVLMISLEAHADTTVRITEAHPKPAQADDDDDAEPEEWCTDEVAFQRAKRKLARVFKKPEM